MTKQKSISTTFAAIILVVAIIVASIAALETVRLNTNTSTTSNSHTSTSSMTTLSHLLSSSSSSKPTTSSTSSTRTMTESSSDSSTSSSPSYGYVIMLQCVSGCVQNLTYIQGYNYTNVAMAWGVNQTSSGGYSGGFTYNPKCAVDCNPSNPNTTFYEYPFPYPTYTSPQLGVYSAVQYVDASSVQFTVAYPGAGNHVYIQGQYPMTIEVSAFTVNRSPNSNVYTTRLSGQPIQTSYITIYPNAASCGGFTVPSRNNFTCSWWMSFFS